MTFHTARTFEVENLKFPGFLSVGTFGAKGDGVTDDRLAIQAAFTAASALGGVTIYFPPGNYFVSRSGTNAYCLDMTADNLTLEGVPNLSWIRGPIGLPNTQVNLLRINTRSKITLRSMGFDGRWGNASTLVAQASTNVSLPQATINVESTVNFPTSGTMTLLSVDASNQRVANTITYTGVTATSFTGCSGGTGTIMRNYACGYVNANTGINQSTQVDPKNHLVFAQAVTDLTIDSCYFTQSYGDMIWLGNVSKNIRILNCVGYMSARNAVTFGSMVLGCIMAGCTWSTIYAQALDSEPQRAPVRDIYVHDNYLDGWWDPGKFTGIGSVPVSIVGAGDWNGGQTYGSAMSNVRFERNHVNGSIFVQYAQDIVISSNHIILDWNITARAAIQIQLGGGDISVLDNWIYTRCGTDPASSDGARGAIVVYNYVTPDPVGYYTPANVQIRGNKIHARNGKNGIMLASAGGAVTVQASRTATSIADLAIVQTGAAWTDNQFLGCVARVGASLATILTNTSDTLMLGPVDNTTGSAWQTFPGNYAPTPTTLDYIIYKPVGVVEVASNDIDLSDDGNGLGGIGIVIDMAGAAAPGGRVRVHDNKIKDAALYGIECTWSSGAQMQLVDISDNVGYNDQPGAATLTTTVHYTGTANVAKWIMGGNIAGEGVTSAVGFSLTTGARWLISDGAVQNWGGYGTPEANVTAPIGSTYQRANGGALTSFYVKETGTGNTGWVGK